MKSAARYFRQFRRLGNVPFGLEQIARQRFALKLCDSMRLARHEACLRLERHNFLHVKRKMLGLYYRGRCEHNRPFDYVF